jgi:hypothetical protein
LEVFVNDVDTALLENRIFGSNHHDKHVLKAIQMDNKSFEVLSYGSEDLRLALQMAGLRDDAERVIGFKSVRLERTSSSSTSKANFRGVEHRLSGSEGVPTLILYAHYESDVAAFSKPIGLEESVRFAEDWLENIPRGQEPRHDGDNEYGWRVFTDDWGHVAGSNKAIVAIQPAWAMYGK